MSYYPEDYYIRTSKAPVTFRSIPISRRNDLSYDNHIVNKPVSSSTRYIGGTPSNYASLSLVNHKGGGGVWRTDGFSSGAYASSHTNDVQFNSYRSLPMVVKDSRPSYNPSYGYIQNSGTKSHYVQRVGNGLKNKSRSQYDLSSTGHVDDDSEDETGYGGHSGDNNRVRRSKRTLVRFFQIIGSLVFRLSGP